MNSVFSTAIAIFLAVFVPGATAHDEETLFNVVHLQARAEREIPNDEMLVVLAAEEEGSDAARIATEINTHMQWALDIVGTYANIDSKTGNYRTYPVYDRQTITGWRASQQLELKGNDMAALTGLVGKLQQRLQVKQMSFHPGDAARRKHENELIGEAIAAFSERVEIVKRQLGTTDYRIVNLNINTGGPDPYMVYEQAAMRTMDQAAKPAVEAGESKLTVTVNGSVQFF